MLDLAVIGGGPAGLSAGLKAASEGLKVAVFEGSDRVGGRPISSPKIENVPGLPYISGPEYAEVLRDQVLTFGGDILVGAKVTDIGRPGDGTLWVGGPIVGREARAVLVTVGMAERELPGITCKQQCDPAELHTHEGERVLFVGGGNSCAMLALACAEAGAHVTILTKRPLAETLSAYLLPRIKEARVLVLIGEARSTWTDPRGGTFLTYDGQWGARSLMYDVVYGFPGGEAKSEWLDVERADSDGRILTGDDVELFTCMERFALPFETSTAGIFAAGDVRYGNTGGIAVAQGEGTQAVQTILREYLPALNRKEVTA